MDHEQLATFRFFLQQWLQETVHMCDEFLREANSEDVWNSDFNKRRMFKEHYILTAATMSRRFASKLRHHSDKETKQLIEEFLNNTKPAGDVRDMREHADAYFTGKGQKQEEFVKGDGNVRCDMTSTIQNEHGYMLGYVIAVEQILNESNKLLSDLREGV